MKILYFAWVREAAGVDEEDIDPPPEVQTAGDVIAWLVARGGGPAQAVADPQRIRVAVNQCHVALSHPVSPGDEIAFFPPVTGGSGR